MYVYVCEQSAVILILINCIFADEFNHIFVQKMIKILQEPAHLEWDARKDSFVLCDSPDWEGIKNIAYALEVRVTVSMYGWHFACM